MGFHVYDPRRDDFSHPVLASHPQYASFAKDFVIIDTIAERRFFGFAVAFSAGVELQSITKLIQTTIQRTGVAGFVMCSSLADNFSLSLQGAHSCIVRKGQVGLVFDPSTDLLEGALALRPAKGRWREWACGSCTDVSAFTKILMERDATTVASLLEVPAHLGCLFWQEGEWLTVFTRIYPGVDDLVSRLLSLDESSSGPVGVAS